MAVPAYFKHFNVGLTLLPYYNSQTENFNINAMSTSGKGTKTTMSLITLLPQIQNALLSHRPNKIEKRKIMTNNKEDLQQYTTLDKISLSTNIRDSTHKSVSTI